MPTENVTGTSEIIVDWYSLKPTPGIGMGVSEVITLEWVTSNNPLME